jgi:putative NADH-flavin reductase
MAPEKSRVRVIVSADGPCIVTGDIPLAKQTIATDAEGGSEAEAMVDEVEQHAHSRQRFTAGY